MPRFDFSHSNELDKILHGDCFIHDSRIVDFQYNYRESRVSLETLHKFYRVKTNFVFHDIHMLLLTKGDWVGERDQIVAVTLEKHSSFPCFDEKSENEKEELLYLTFQTFSGDEIHVAAKEVEFESVHL